MEPREELKRFEMNLVTGEVRQVMDEFGRELPDPVPVAPPIGYKKQPSMVEIVRNMVRSERLRVEAEAMGKESFEDADDFDIPDDPVDPSSPYENDFDPPVKELVKAGAEVVKEKKKAAKKAAEEAASKKPPEVGKGDVGVE